MEVPTSSQSPPTTPRFVAVFYLDPLKENPGLLYAMRSSDQLDTSYFKTITIGGIVGVKNGEETNRAIIVDFDSKLCKLRSRYSEAIAAFQAAGKPQKYDRQYNSLKYVNLAAVEDKYAELLKESMRLKNMVAEHQIAQRLLNHQIESTPKRFKRDPLINIEQNIILNPEEPLDLSRKSISEREALPDPRKSPVTPTFFNVDFDEMVILGSGGTKIKRIKFDAIPWNTPCLATRALLRVLFEREELGTQTYSGKPSPAWSNKPRKERLDPVKINDVIEVVSKICKVPVCEVKRAITTTCADECKLMKKRLEKTREEIIEL